MTDPKDYIPPAANIKLKVSQSGFTLLEMVLVISIMAVFGTLISSYYGGATTAINLDDAAVGMEYDIKNAQARSMNGINGERWGVCFRNPAGDDLYEIVSPLGSSACTGATVVSTFFLPNGITYSVPAEGEMVSVIFNKISGSSDSLSDTTVAIVLKDESREITITPAGKIYHPQ